jgi:O-antigen ligase
MVGYVACLAFVTVVWTGLPAVAARFSYDTAPSPIALGGRVDLWNDALDVMRRFPLTGTGLNTYTIVTPFYQERDTPTSDEVHNDYLQLAAEGGLLVGLPAIGLAIVFIREVRRRFRAGAHSLTSYWLRVGAVAGLLAIAVQESVEFSLQLPGNAVMFAALCAIALHGPEGKRP